MFGSRDGFPAVRHICNFGGRWRRFRDSYRKIARIGRIYRHSAAARPEKVT